MGFYVLQLLVFLGLLGAGIAVWHASLWLRGHRGAWRKAWSVVLAAACVSISWVALTLNLVKFNLYY